MKKLLILSIVMIAILTGCTPNSDSALNQQQDQSLTTANNAIGLPNIHNFFEKKTLKKIMEMRDMPNLTTYTYTESLDGHFVYVGRSIGYGIPYATQYTNPMKYEGTGLAMPQADPNGLFSPSSANATWILLVDEKTNEPFISYVEPNMVVYEKKLPKRLVAAWSLPSDY